MIAEQAPALYRWMIRRGTSGLAALAETGLEQSVFSVAAGLAGLARLDGLGRAGAVPPALRADWARATLRVALKLSLSHLAAEIYRALDRDAQARLAADPGSGWDMRRPLAGALATEGARALAAPLDVGPEESHHADSKPGFDDLTCAEAFLWTRSGSSGGTYKATKIDGAWKLEGLGSWIS